MQPEQIKSILEAALMAADEPLSLSRLAKLLGSENTLKNNEIKSLLDVLSQDLEGRAVELKEVATGYRIQVKAEFAPWIHALWEEKPPRYSRALLETLAIITYKQPLTRAEIEEIRGVAVSTNIVKTLSERGWVNVVGHKELPGRPALLATTKQFLDDFNLTSLNDLPSLTEISNLEEAEQQLGQQLDLLTNLENVSAPLDQASEDSPEQASEEPLDQASEDSPEQASEEPPVHLSDQPSEDALESSLSVTLELEEAPSVQQGEPPEALAQQEERVTPEGAEDEATAATQEERERIQTVLEAPSEEELEHSANVTDAA